MLDQEANNKVVEDKEKRSLIYHNSVVLSKFKLYKYGDME